MANRFFCVVFSFVFCVHVCWHFRCLKWHDPEVSNMFAKKKIPPNQRLCEQHLARYGRQTNRSREKDFRRAFDEVVTFRSGWGLLSNIGERLLLVWALFIGPAICFNAAKKSLANLFKACFVARFSPQRFLRSFADVCSSSKSFYTLVNTSNR